jgi:hypothetical protein
VVTDPKTGEAKTKKKLGGAYPGQRRPQHAPYVPPASDFGKDGTATAHFIAHGGGNALVLVQNDGTHSPQAGKPQSEYVQGTELVCVCQRPCLGNEVASRTNDNLLHPRSDVA